MSGSESGVATIASSISALLSFSIITDVFISETLHLSEGNLLLNSPKSLGSRYGATVGIMDISRSPCRLSLDESAISLSCFILYKTTRA